MESNYDYNIGDVIYNIWSDKYFVIVDFEYKDTSKFYTIRDLSTDKIIVNEWLYSKRLIYNKGNFNGYETEFRIATKSEAAAKFRKEKIKNLLNMDFDLPTPPSDDSED